RGRSAPCSRPAPACCTPPGGCRTADGRAGRARRSNGCCRSASRRPVAATSRRGRRSEGPASRCERTTPVLCFCLESVLSARVRIGVAREIKTDEYRVALTPAGARELVQKGHDVLVEAGAGDGSAMPDDDYVGAV